MRYQQRISMQNSSSCIRNSDILNVNMSSDLCTFVSPVYNLIGGTKIIDQELGCDLSGVDFDNMIVTSFNNCGLTGSTVSECFEKINWNLEVNEDDDVVYSGTILTTTATADTLSQSQVDAAVITAFDTLGYDYTISGSVFTVTKPFGVENLTVDLCLDVDTFGTGATCPSGYVLNPEGDGCIFSATTAATYNGAGSAIVGGTNSGSFGSSGARFYENITDKPLPIIRPAAGGDIEDASGNTISVQVSDNSVFWGNPSTNISDGRLNNIGVRGNPRTEWQGFSHCIEIETTRVYYVGIAADNFVRFRINSERFVEFDTTNYTHNFTIWHVFPVTLTSGKNIIELEGKDDGSGDISYGLEIYSATTLEILTGATDSTSAGVIFTTEDKITETFDLGETVGYSCPSGYSLDLCSVVTGCTQIIHEPLSGCALTGQCDNLCVVLCDNTYEVIDSGSTGVYVVETATTIDFGFQFTGNTDSFVDNTADFKYEVYKYNHTTGVFGNTPVYKAGNFDWADFSATTILEESIPISELDLDGDYLIKGYFTHEVCTDFLGRLGVVNDTSTNKNGESYNLYKKAFDYYFVALNEADEPTFNFDPESDANIGNLVGFSIFPSISGQTEFTVTLEKAGSPMVSLNGLTLVEDIEYVYSNSANTLTISGGTQLTDVITIVAVSAGEDLGFKNDYINITNPIVSGVTDSQGSESVYYNTSESKYEIFTSITPVSGNDIIVTLNGLTLAANIDYYQSITNPKRIILEGIVGVGDIINIYYNGSAQYVENIFTNTPTIFWSIENEPETNNGVFTVEVATSTDTDFTTLVASATTDYVVNQTAYSANLSLTGSAGTTLIYRVKNEKNYTTLIGDEITNVNYSEIIPMQIQSNGINSY